MGVHVYKEGVYSKVGVLSIVFVSSKALLCMQQFGSSIQESKLLQVLGPTWWLVNDVSKMNNNKWIDDTTGPLMIDLETIIALAPMTYI